MAKIISGIQQIGIGVPDVQEIWKWYRKFLSNDVRIFEEAAEAPLMINYTGNKVQSRTATLAISLEGGGGFEIWQFTSRKTEKPSFEIKMGDLGIYITRVKCKDVEKTFAYYKKEGVQILGDLVSDPAGNKHFYFKDPNDNIFEIVQGREWFANTKALCGGVDGVVMGVSNIERSRKLYSEILGYDQVIYDQTGVFDDLKSLPGGDQEIRRVLLTHSQPRKGPFSRLLGTSQIELFQLTRGNGKKIFENRYWGDWGFIHLCFDVKDMESLRKECEAAGFPFTVDSKNTFDMGEAGGQFSYIEDPDGALIEFVETHKIPVIKKLGWYLNLRKRPVDKPLPDWILKALRFNRVKN